MNRKRCTILGVGVAAAGIAVALAGSLAAGRAVDVHTQWNTLASAYFSQVYFVFNPTSGSYAGLHQYDRMLEDYSRAGIDRKVEAYKRFEKRVDEFNAAGLSQEEVADREIVLSNIKGTLLSLEDIRGWEKNPDNYSTGITNSAYVIMSRKYAPANTRLHSLVAREKLMPAALMDARQNLKNPPHIFTEIALEQLPGDISFFQHDVPSAFMDATDPEVKAEFSKTNAAVISALQDYEKWLHDVELSASKGDFAVGADVYSKKLLYDEMVDTPLDKLLALNQDNMKANQAEFARVAKELDPTKTPQQVLAELQADHTTPDKLLQAFRNTFGSLISFIRQKHIVTIPSNIEPTVQETPPFMRATTSASMDMPGPFETGSKTAYFNVTLPDPNAPPKEREELMEEFNIGTVISTAVHEAYPGHYVQLLWLSRAPSKVRKLLGSNTDIEGWAHYCEQMMLDQGYGQPGTGAKDEREAKLIRLGQLSDALLRNARFTVGIQMHRRQMTFDQAVDYFVKEGYQSHAVGLMEAKRGTGDPTYLYYTLGKLQILKLRSDMEKKEGAAFSLEKFHDDFLKQGFPPVKVVRQALLGDSSPTL
ncbi:MAG TPA: DUF885 domain-containing protein [Candidatus Acidoferrales bacterium]|nr:DUF885 domain-containing protein [Candidatus Acidoferrales bacterium]